MSRRYKCLLKAILCTCMCMYVCMCVYVCCMYVYICLYMSDCSPRKPGSQIIRGLGLRETLQPQPRPCPELSSSFSPRHELVQSYLHPSVPATASSRVIFIFQSQPRPRPELSLSFNNIHDLVQRYLYLLIVQWTVTTQDVHTTVSLYMYIFCIILIIVLL